ncbi:MAG: 4Fe-4S dicluster domain-containing protein [Lachnospiraceae bacterium]|nr:4Fe-4S dicluster domain-containing protein [Lachnospiraceae bacterium]
MLGIYFSGTGNSRYALEFFMKQYDKSASVCPLTDQRIVNYINDNEEIVFSYSIQFSNIPKMLKDFVDDNKNLWNGKKIFVITTMGLFSGDGAGILARRLRKYGAQIQGGLHLKMPDSIADEKALKRPLEKNKMLVKAAEEKIKRAVQSIKCGNPPQEGIGFLYHMVGLFGQRLYFYRKTQHYTDQIKINAQKCIGCGKCAMQCPMNNIHIAQNTAKSSKRCTMCYCCINICPQQAITLLGKSVVQQGTIEKYL